MLYIAQRCQGHARFGGTKLNKILFYSDFFSYGKKGTPITGAEYFKLEFGPVPKRLMAVQSNLEDAGDAVVQKSDFLGKEQKRLVALRDPDLSLFRADEIELVNKVIEKLEHMSAEEVSDLSHIRIWRITKLKQSIPYQAYFVSDKDADEADIDAARHLISEHNWSV